MPEMDTAWQKSREIIALLHRLADDCGATQKKGFAQSMYLASAGGKAGICFGLSVGYLLEIAKTGRADAFLATAFTSAAKRISDRSDVGANKFHMDVSNEFHNLQYGSLHKDFLKDKGALKFVEEKAFDQSFYRHTKVAEYLTKAEGLYLIKTPNHALAATAAGGQYAFFDPNVGEFIFGDAKRFRQLIVKYFDNPRIAKGYAGRKGTKIDDQGAHKTIHFLIDRFIR